MKGISLSNNKLLLVVLMLITTLSYAGAPLWTFTPLTATTLSVPSNDTATVQYTVTNQSSRVHTLSMQPIPGIVQITTGLGLCGNPFVLSAKSSCTLSLQVIGSEVSSPINNGPIVFEQSSSLQGYRPASSDILHITQAPAITDATITVTDSPLTLIADGPTGTLTIYNTSLIVTATNILSNFTGTDLDGKVTEIDNTCANVLPQSSCTLTYRPGSMVVAQTDFPIQGSNTNAVTAAIQIDAIITINTVSPSSGPASGGTGVTVTGTGFIGATSLTFDNIPATSLNVVNSTTVTAVTPAHVTGAVDVAITAPLGTATKTSGFTYLTTAVGQSAYGGKIACLDSGNNLIAATSNISNSIQWGGFGTTTSAASTTDGATNTQRIVNVLGANGGVPYSAQLCSNYAVDSQGNSPCQLGNTCYSDWFLPAGNNTNSSGQLNCLYTNRVAIGGFGTGLYWSSTEFNGDYAWYQQFSDGAQANTFKSSSRRVRCVRSFTP